MYIVLVTISDVSRVVGLERDSGHSENARKRTSTKSEDHLHQMETLTLDVVDSEESRRQLDEMISSIAGLVTMNRPYPEATYEVRSSQKLVSSTSYEGSLLICL